jgi:hypothetical protein
MGAPGVSLRFHGFPGGFWGLLGPPGSPGSKGLLGAHGSPGSKGLLGVPGFPEDSSELLGGVSSPRSLGS